MDLTALLLRAGARRPHALLVPAVGGMASRFAVEAELARRGWPAATSPADADLLVVAGTAGPRLAAVVEDVWRQMSAPRARVDVPDADGVGGRLDAAAALLGDAAGQRVAPPASAAAAAGPRPVAHGAHESDGAHGSDGGHESDGGHGGHGAHGSQGGHGGHGEMEMPGGLPMADLGEDRDGLTLDRLHVSLGPVLPDWPAGLVLHLTLQGDVIQEVEAEVLDVPDPQAKGSTRAAGTYDSRAAGPDSRAAGPDSRGRGPRHAGAVRELDAVARLLGAAGWADAAARARRLRDELRAAAPPEHVAGRAAALARRVRRSRTLRWLLRGIAAGELDLHDVLSRRIAAVENAFGGRDGVHEGAGGTLSELDGVVPPRVDVAGLPALLVGAELAAARLIVAAVDPDTDAATEPAEPRRA